MTGRATRTCATCGHHGTYANEGSADYHFGRHSCAVALERRAIDQRRVDRLTLDGTVRGCDHEGVHHEHGTALAYIRDRCRCAPCRLAKNAAERARDRAKAYGRHPWVDAEPVRDHVRTLRAQGMGFRRILAAAGVPYSSGQTLFYRKGRADQRLAKRISAESADRILAVQLDLAPSSLVSGPAAARRLQALAALGWSQKLLAREVGLLPGELGFLIRGERRPSRATADAVEAAYDRLWDRQPPRSTKDERGTASGAAKAARRAGWAPPLAWDDDTIGDPTAHPAHDLQPTRAKGQRDALRMVHVIDVEVLADAGLTRHAIAARLDVSPESLQNSLQRAGRRDLWVRLSHRDHITTSPRRAAA